MESPQLLSCMAQLAATIAASVAELDGTLAAKVIPSPSFDEDGHVPSEAVSVQDAIIDAAGELIDLLREPLTILFLDAAHNASIPLQYIAKFRVADMVPAGGEVSYASIAEETGIEEQLVRRLVRYAMTMRVFHEPEPNMVAHTRTSKALMTNPNIPLNDWLRMGTGEMWPASVRTVDAAQKWPAFSEPGQTGYSLADNASDPIYDIVGRDPERAVIFANTMKVFASQPGFATHFITQYYDWASLGDKVRVVDVGGPRGFVAMALADHHPNLTAIVKDLAMVVAGADAGVPEALKGRIEFQAHDLLAEQTVDADVYYLRWVLHNWSDKYCIQILRAQIPMLRQGAKVIIQETVIPEPGQISNWRERPQNERFGYDVNLQRQGADSCRVERVACRS